MINKILFSERNRQSETFSSYIRAFFPTRYWFMFITDGCLFA